MNAITMSNDDTNAFNLALGYTKSWCINHQWEIGVAEMALGAAAVAWGIQNGVIEMGQDIVVRATTSSTIGEQAGAALGGTAGVIGGAILGGIGVAAAGTAIGIPAAVVIGGGALIFGSLGYTTGDLMNKFLNPPVDIGEFLGGASVLAVGLALLIDGARRVVSDQRVLRAASKLVKGVIHLSKVTGCILAETYSELTTLSKSILSLPENTSDYAGSLATGAALAATGTAVGSSLAAGSVTVMGSQALGSTALALGLVSTPVLPVIAGGVAGLALGYGAWKSARHFILAR